MPSVSEPGVVEHEPGDLTCVVEGGLRLSALQARARAARQMLALDPPGDPTLGACLPTTSPARGATATARCATS